MDRPNIILLITHDTGQHISPYGVPTVDTPNCERLAKQSVLFEKSFCAAPQCSPSRASIVTGRFPHANGVMGLTHADFGWALHKDERPIARLLSEAGYATCLLGLQHETGDPHTLGFSRVDLGFSLLDVPEYLNPFLDDLSKDQPFYCQIGCFETHRPFVRDNSPPDDRLGITVPPYLVDGPETREEMRHLQGLVKRFDTGLGQILDLLDQRGLSDDTLLVVTTDHGLAMPRAKGSLFDPGIETFLFMRYPKRFAGGRRCGELVSNVDILPTVLEYAKVGCPENVHGRSFVPLLEGGNYSSRQEIFAEKTFHGCYDPMRCIRTQTHKYIRYFEKSTIHRVPSDIMHQGAERELGVLRRVGREALYDLVNDPQEANNLAEESGYSELCQELRQRLYQWMVQTGDPILNGPIASPFFHRGMQEFTSSNHDE